MTSLNGNIFPRYWSFVQGIHRSPVNSPHKGQWQGALMFCLILAWMNGWVNNRGAGDLRRHRAHCDVTVIFVKRCDVITHTCHHFYAITIRWTSPAFDVHESRQFPDDPPPGVWGEYRSTSGQQPLIAAFFKKIWIEPWWRHQMETFPRYWFFVRRIHWSPVNLPSRRPVTRSFDVFLDLRLNKRLSKPSRRR